MNNTTDNWDAASTNQCWKKSISPPYAILVRLLIATKLDLDISLAKSTGVDVGKLKSVIVPIITSVLQDEEVIGGGSCALRIAPRDPRKHEQL